MTSYTFKMMTSNSLKVGSNLMAVPSKISLRMNPGCSYARVDVCLEKKNYSFDTSNLYRSKQKFKKDL